MSYQKGNKILADLGVDTESIIKSYTRRRLNRKPKKSFDGDMYDAIKPYLCKDSFIAGEVKRAVEDNRITKNFCEEKKLYEQVERFENLSTFRPSMRGKDAYEWAWILLREMIHVPKTKLKPLDVIHSEPNEIFSNPDASAGYLAYPKKKREVPQLIRDVAKEIMKDYDKAISFPAIALTRSQLGDFIVEGRIDSSHISYKTRLVMCVDAASVLVEQQFGQPLLDFIFKAQPQYAGGKDDFRIRDFLLLECKGKRWVSLDYSKFDSTIQNWLIKDVFDFLSEFFSTNYKKAFEWITNNFINMQLLMPDGSIHNLHKGIKSGSYFTQIVGSLCNVIMILTYFCAKYGERNERNEIINISRVRNELMSFQHPTKPKFFTIMAMGDDNIFFTQSSIDMKDLSGYLFHNFGAIITIDGDKGYDEGDTKDFPHFLKRTWKMTGQEREPLDMFVNLLHPERRRSYNGYSVWHIIFGYFLTFEGTMSKYFNRMDIIQLMHENYGIEALSEIRLGELPGSLRSQILNRGVDRDELVSRLKRELYLHRSA